MNWIINPLSRASLLLAQFITCLRSPLSLQVWAISPFEGHLQHPSGLRGLILKQAESSEEDGELRAAGEMRPAGFWGNGVGRGA